MSNKFIFILSIIVSLNSTFINGQETHNFEFKTDSLVIDGVNLSPNTISSQIQVGTHSFFDLLTNDSIGIRIRVKLTKRGAKSNKIKIRIDFKENGKWFKPPLFIDFHNFTRFRIRREQCWQRKKFWGVDNNGYPINMICDCRKPFKTRKKHEMILSAQVKVD